MAMTIEPDRQSGLFSRNIVVAGETGVGKSSFINLVTGTDSARTTNDIDGVTCRTSAYAWKTDTHAFRLWDTPGLSEGSFGNVSPKVAEQALSSLLRKLGKEGGVHLLVLCMRGIETITKGMKLTYNTICRIRDEVSPHIPVVAVITELEKRCKKGNIESSMETWWTSNESLLAAFGMTFRGYACLTTILDSDHPPMRGRKAKCQRLAQNLLINHALPLSANVVVVGEIGVGKSSFINLVAGTDSATTANGVTTWEADTHTHAFRLWDTLGLGQGSSRTVDSQEAQDHLRSLLRERDKEGGVHLLVLCMRGTPTITMSMKLTYAIVRRIRDEVSPHTPIVAVITELEKRCEEGNIESSMEAWWTSNESGFAASGMTFCGHVCLTNVPDNWHPLMEGRRTECQRLARNLLIDHAFPFSAFNVVIVGETGVGKSSFINLITGTDSATTNGVTTYARAHTWKTDTHTHSFRLWDTPGLGKGSSGDVPLKAAQRDLHSLFRELDRDGGVHLLVLCMRGTPTITARTKLTYAVVRRIRDEVSPQTPIVAAITGLEQQCEEGNIESSMEAWWMSNESRLAASGMTFCGHACLTNVPDNYDPPMEGRHTECQRVARNFLIDHALLFFAFNVILFGETDVGKSSLVNLLAGRPVAKVSPDSVACTLASTEYQFQFGAAMIRLWDTAGLGGPVDQANGHMDAIEKAVELIRHVGASGGVNLLLFCVRAVNQVTTAMQSNYRLFYEILGRQQVPIALVVTHLEREPVMDAWWKNNAKMLEHGGIRVGGHACITTLEGHAKYTESRQVVHELLSRYADQSRFSMPPETWLEWLLSGLNALLGFKLPKGKAFERVLMERCHLESELAKRVAARIGRP